MSYELGELQRQLMNVVRVGKVSALDEGGARVKVSVSGLTTDWLPWLASRAGATRTWSAPREGEQVLVLSPYGDTAQGVVLPSIYQDSYPAPAGSKDRETTVYPDGTTVEYDSAAHALVVSTGPSSVTVRRDLVELTVGGVTLSVSSAGVAISGGQVTHNGKNIGDTHQHSGIQPGPANTGAPV